MSHAEQPDGQHQQRAADRAQQPQPRVQRVRQVKHLTLEDRGRDLGTKHGNQARA